MMGEASLGKGLLVIKYLYYMALYVDPLLSSPCI